MKSWCETATEETELVLSVSSGLHLHHPGEPGVGRDWEAEDLTLDQVGPQHFPLQGGQSSRSSLGQEVDRDRVASVVEQHLSRLAFKEHRLNTEGSQSGSIQPERAGPVLPWH